MKSIYSAPLQGFTESAWRNAHAQIFGGIDAYYTPFIRQEKGEVRNKDKREVSSTRNLVSNLIPQVVASTPEELRFLIHFLSEQGYHEIDLNMGCPFPLIAKRKKGAGILPYPEQVALLLDELKHWEHMRFTLKMRLGWQECDEWRKLLPLLNKSCIQRVTLHPRIGKQQYKGNIDMESFRAFYQECALPLVYNGDLQTEADVCRICEEFPNLEGVMLGRGLLANPSLAMSVKEGKSMTTGELYVKVWEMHQLILESYAVSIEGGESQLLQKLKTQWEYLLPDLEKKARKQILKSNNLKLYQQNVSLALRGF